MAPPVATCVDCKDSHFVWFYSVAVSTSALRAESPGLIPVFCIIAIIVEHIFMSLSPSSSLSPFTLSLSRSLSPSLVTGRMTAESCWRSRRSTVCWRLCRSSSTSSQSWLIIFSWMLASLSPSLRYSLTPSVSKDFMSSVHTQTSLI